MAGAAALLAASLMYPARVFTAVISVATAGVAVTICRRIGEPPLIQVISVVGVVAAAVAIHGTRRTGRNAVAPTLLAQASIPAAAAVAGLSGGLWLIPAGAVVTTCWAWRAEFAVTVVAWRASLRSGIRYVAGYPRPSRADVEMAVENLRVGTEAEVATAKLLVGLGPRWHVLHSRALHATSADADHIVIGPPGVVLVDSKFRSGIFECSWSDGEGAAASWTFNGQPLRADLVRSALFEADRIAWAFRADLASGQPVPTVLAIHGARMNVAWGTAEFEVSETDPRSGEEVVVATRLVTLVAVEHLVDYLRQLPARRFTEPSRAERRCGRARGLSDADVLQVAQDRFIVDLAAVADHLFIPVR
ncbi:nuclease-related domain-containing protein [Nocardia sp. NPDC052566]|uniref:nuclease-related domain-containing protein n=1 Tax=Nocardia sp. NPDC052566 TaxID=3364330 RepID=UPI0037C9FAF8